MLIYSMSVSVADVWCAIPKIVFSRTLDSVQGNARLAEGSVAEEAAAALDATDKDEPPRDGRALRNNLGGGLLAAERQGRSRGTSSPRGSVAP